MSQGPAKNFIRKRVGGAGYPGAGRGKNAGGEVLVSCSGEAPAASIIDITHLGRMTFGDMALEAEVLALFDRQAAMLLARMHGAPPSAAAAFAHTICGSARGVGAWKVAAAAEEVERAAREAGAGTVADALRALEGAIREARAAVRELLATGPLVR